MPHSHRSVSPMQHWNATCQPQHRNQPDMRTRCTFYFYSKHSPHCSYPFYPTLKRCGNPTGKATTPPTQNATQHYMPTLASQDTTTASETNPASEAATPPTTAGHLGLFLRAVSRASTLATVTSSFDSTPPTLASTLVKVCSMRETPSATFPTLSVNNPRV